MNQLKDYYAILQVPRNATFAEIKHNYRMLAKQFHPDKNNNDPWATEKFREIQEAYDILSNTQKRQQYDAYLNGFSAYTASSSSNNNYHYPGVSNTSAVSGIWQSLQKMIAIAGGMFFVLAILIIGRSIIEPFTSGRIADQIAAMSIDVVEESANQDSQNDNAMVPSSPNQRPTSVSSEPRSTPQPRPTATPSTRSNPSSNSSCQSRVGLSSEIAAVTVARSRMRSSPSLDSRSILVIPFNGVVNIIDGPRCEDNLVWWRGQYSGEIGWIAERAPNGTQLLSRRSPSTTNNTSDGNISSWPPSNRYSVPTNGVLLSNGRGLSNGAVQNNGNFQVEGYCNIIGGRAREDGTNWFCGGTRLSTDHFDQICQLTYSNPTAAAFRVGGNRTVAYNWRCYGAR